MTDAKTIATEEREIEAAIRVLEEIAHERGVENGWLYEVDKNVPWPDDPRVGLVQGGPDVVMMLVVAPLTDLLRDGLNRTSQSTLRRRALVFARAINTGAALPTIHTDLTDMVKSTLSEATGLPASRIHNPPRHPLDMD